MKFKKLLTIFILLLSIYRFSSEVSKTDSNINSQVQSSTIKKKANGKNSFPEYEKPLVLKRMFVSKINNNFLLFSPLINHSIQELTE